ncbi:metallophosphoesterase [Xylophilus ampelinus]|uniref:Calcineurin-like phosphoesterase domain-containing protein n=1 Tax=Xylophilus ampelinus TaxID=54067 RepID=A0A318SHW2_9BURK|nr:metallophosphoesterase [Xylophilus ampelinus]MCS4510007.1 metallophosphoesterase [Xylophilus ampelinus]PYE78413.1 hypothetical protein DFQ15_10763 [Xylophilus ampelinus]
MPIKPFFLLTALLHAYVALRLVPGLAPWWPAGIGLGALLLVSAGALPVPLRARRTPLHPAWQWLGAIAMGWFSSLLVLTLLRDLLLAAWWAAGAAGLAAAPAPAAWRHGSAAAVVLAAVSASALGLWNARRTARVRRIDIALPQLPAALQGFTIAQLSDLHVGPTIGRGYIARIVDRVNALQPDLVAITGDLVDGSVPTLRDRIAPLAGLRSRHGSYVVTGNHEYYAGAHAWIDELRRIGLTVLMNEHVLLRPGSAVGAAEGTGRGDADALLLAGVTDFHAVHFDAAHASDPVRALQGAPTASTTRVLLAHQPRSAPAAADAGFQLQLSGHTHGGQFWPWNLFVPLQQPFVAGLHRLRGLQVYVSRGTGYWGPPKRLGAPSEITLLRLVRQG